MTEAYNISSRLTFTSNAATVVADLFVQFEKLDRVITATQGGLGKLSSELRTLGGGTRGINSTRNALEKLGQVKMAPSVLENIGRVTTAARQLAEVQSAIARSAAEGAAAWRSMAQSAPRAMSRLPANGGLPPVTGGGGGPVGGGPPGNGPRGNGGGRRGRGQSGPWEQVWRDDFPNAQAENRNFDQIRDNQRRQAEYENQAFDTRAAAAAKAAADRKREADLAAGNKYDADHYQAMQENAVRDARARRGRMSHTDWTNAAMGAQMGGQAGMGFFGSALKAEMEVREHLAMLRTNSGIGDKEIAEARAVGERITRETPGSTLAENMHHIVDAFTVMGDLHEALQGAPAFAKAAYLIKNMPGIHQGDSSFAAAQAVEVMQRHVGPDGKINMAEFNKAMESMVQVAYGTGGRVNGASYLGFAKQSRAGGMVADDQYLYRDLPALLIALGGNRAGTGDAAVWNQFVTGKMTANAFHQLQKAGIVDSTADWQHGQVLDMEHHLRGADGFARNRVQWVRDEFLGPNGVFARNGIDPHDKMAAERFLSKWASRQTGLGFLSETVLGMNNIDKEAIKIDETKKAGGIQNTLREHDPMQAVREFRAAENELMVAMGREALGPALEMLKSLTAAIQEMGKFARENPTLTKDLVLIGGGLSLLGNAAGSVAMVLFMGAPVVKGLWALASALSPFGAGGEAAVGLAGASSGLSALAVGLRALAGPLALVLGALWLGGHVDPKKAEEQLNDLGKQRRAPTPLDNMTPQDGYGVDGKPLPDKHSSLTRPPDQGNVTFLATITLDGQAIAKNIEGRLVRSGSGPSGGSTGFDQRTVYSGGMAA